MFENAEEGEVILIDKPYEWTSFDVVNKIRTHFKYRRGIKKIKIGHAGTLDPLATGLLILCTGKFTKKIDEYQALEKEYTGTLFLGATTPSSDMETEADTFFPVAHISPKDIFNVAATFIGKSMQIPPSFSAKKIKGERAYEIARRGDFVEIPAKEINITEFEITRIEIPYVDFRIVCSKGTYIRAIASDLGIKLKSGAYLSALRRTRIGLFKVEDAFSLEKIQSFFE
jgi:tRNA pseudouridine55 synthase